MEVVKNEDAIRAENARIPFCVVVNFIGSLPWLPLNYNRPRGAKSMSKITHLQN